MPEPDSSPVFMTFCFLALSRERTENWPGHWPEKLGDKASLPSPGLMVADRRLMLVVRREGRREWGFDDLKNGAVILATLRGWGAGSFVSFMWICLF
jgi:hypothetical protein